MDCRLFVTFSLLLGTALALCPHEEQGLGLWSDPQTWSTGLVIILRTVNPFRQKRPFILTLNVHKDYV